MDLMKSLLNLLVKVLFTHSSETYVAGARGMIMGSTASFLKGRAGYLFTNPRRPLYFPAVQVSEGDYLTIIDTLSDGNNHYGRIISGVDSENPYAETMGTLGPFATVFLGITASVIVVLAFFVLGLEVSKRDGHLVINIKVVLLFFVLALSVLKLAFALADFEGHSRQIGWPLIIFYQMINIPGSIVCILLLSLYWFESLSGLLLHKSGILSATRIPFIIVCCLFFVLVVVLLIILISDPLVLNYTVALLGIIYSIIWFTLSVFHLVTACLVDAQLKKIAKNTKQKRAVSFMVKIIIISIIDIISILLLLMISGGGVLSSPFSTVFAVIMFNFLTDLSPFLILTLFEWHFKAAVSKSKTRNSGNKTME
eukprot:TRINITY_DN391_c0_g1_i1.p1 TRINITY_DN391_c0_g1~~TRINITY_DN391_c0_g1_i1.p1  ORF type:complete len:368 (+),score=31.60 TRINITY_DN391_c0_g1_i1:307-1410(+)